MRHVNTFVVTYSPVGRWVILEVDAAETGALCRRDIHKHKTMTRVVHPGQEINTEALTYAFAMCPSYSIVVAMEVGMQEAMKLQQ